LGFSGGTLDKMESIPGFRCSLSTVEFIEKLRAVGLVLAGQTVDLAPADGKLYALRDVTGTVQSIPLIASSIMSKKIAGGAKAIVLDVKIGNGAFMQTLEAGRVLAETMVLIAHHTERKAVALLSDMNQPLGEAVGNALEVREAIDTMHGSGPVDFREHCLVVASHMLVLGGIADNERESRQMAEKALDDGRSWERFRDLVRSQGGDLRVVDEPQFLPKARLVQSVNSPRTGYLSLIDAKVIGETAVVLGAGRAKKSDPVDHSVGIIVHHKVGDKIEMGSPLFTIHANNTDILDQSKRKLMGAIGWSDEPIEPLPLFYEIIR
jgi:pyrimidine-nucleoside phosphorylase